MPEQSYKDWIAANNEIDSSRLSCLHQNSAIRLLSDPIKILLDLTSWSPKLNGRYGVGCNPYKHGFSTGLDNPVTFLNLNTSPSYETPSAVQSFQIISLPSSIRFTLSDGGMPGASYS
jgi:hypothetical protein